MTPKGCKIKEKIGKSDFMKIQNGCIKGHNQESQARCGGPHMQSQQLEKADIGRITV
jgi:hypothetical protein